MLPIQNQQPQIFLMVEDNPFDIELYSTMIYQAFGQQSSIVCVGCFKQAILALSQNEFHVLLLDMNLPDQSGVENIIELGTRFPQLPIIVLTGSEDLTMALRSLQHGAQDFLPKNHVTPELLARCVHYAKERKKIELQLKSALKNAANTNTLLHQQANHDSLTGLANRVYFQDVANHLIQAAKRKRKPLALIYFDLNEFKKINDTYGHLSGDELLKQVAQRLKTVVRDSDFLARLSGDEFVIITDVLNSKKDIHSLLKRVLEQFNKEFTIGTHTIKASASMGVAFYPDSENLDQLIKHADCAMYEAKKNQKDIRFYSSALAIRHRQSEKIETLLAEGIARKEFYSFFQPLINVNDPNEVHLEALARWQSDKIGCVSPDEFIPVAESSPIINSISQMIISCSAHIKSLLGMNQMPVERIAINISVSQLYHPNFCTTFLQWLETNNLDPKTVCIELTERQTIQNFAQCKKQFASLAGTGIQIALDDFGSGFSSVTHLMDLHFDILKIDRLLIKDLDKNTRNQALTAGIVEMAHRLDMQVVAEGIENQEEEDQAISIGCDYLQGYHLAKPLTKEATANFYLNRQRLP